MRVAIPLFFTLANKMWMGVSCSFLGHLKTLPTLPQLAAILQRLATVQAQVLNEKHAGNHSGYVICSHNNVSLLYCRVIFLVLFGRANVQNKSSSCLQSLASTKDVVAMIWSNYSSMVASWLEKMAPTCIPSLWYILYIKKNTKPEAWETLGNGGYLCRSSLLVRGYG